MRSVGLLLAAGRSRRFGTYNKLLAELHGAPLVCHAANALRGAVHGPLIAVVEEVAVADVLAGFEIVAPGPDAPAQSASLRAGTEAAERLGAERLVIVLADMPFVSSGLIRDVMARSSEATGAAARHGEVRLPPASLPRSVFPEIHALVGDRGAGSILRTLPDDALVPASAQDLMDVDSLEDLRQAFDTVRD